MALNIPPFICLTPDQSQCRDRITTREGHSYIYRGKDEAGNCCYQLLVGGKKKKKKKVVPPVPPCTPESTCATFIVTEPNPLQIVLLQIFVDGVAIFNTQAPNCAGFIDYAQFNLATSGSVQGQLKPAFASKIIVSVVAFTPFSGTYEITVRYTDCPPLPISLTFNSVDNACSQPQQSGDVLFGGCFL